MADFRKVLQTIAIECDAQRCILWERLDDVASEDRRFVALSEYFPNLTWYYIPSKTYTGLADETRETQIVNSLDEAIAAGYETNARLKKLGVGSYCAIPVQLDSKRRGVLNLYRDADQRFFTSDEVKDIEALAKGVPHLFRSVLNEVGLGLLRQVESLLRTNSMGFQPVLEAVADRLGAMECVLYLRDPRDGESFKRMAQVWPWPWPSRESYQLSDHGLTAQVLRTEQSLHFVDLKYLAEDCSRRNIVGVEHRTVDKMIEARLEALKAEEPPPLSYINAPIKDSGRVIGSLRCCVSYTNTYLFDSRHLEVLEYVADQIGERWGTKILLSQTASERKLFSDFAGEIDRLNVTSLQQLNATPVRADRQFSAALRALERLIGCGDALSIRLVDLAHQELYIAATEGPKWTADGPRRSSERLAQRFALDGDCSGSLAIRKKEIVIDRDCQSPGHNCSGLFSDATSILHAPILVGNDPVGVLDIRLFNDEQFPPHTDTLASLLARHLGVYHQMYQNFARVQAASESLRRERDLQSRIYDDFHHQIHDPIQKTHFFAQKAVRQGIPDKETLRSIRSNARRAEQVAANLHRFAAITREAEVTLNLEYLLRPTLLAHLSEMAEDQQVLAREAGRGLTFSVDSGSFDCLDRITVAADMELFDHAVANLLDNATKYSRKNTEVLIRASLSSGHRGFGISVFNRGHVVSSADRLKLAQRGYRGDAASQRVVVGQGIGLFIVEHLMEAMGGHLEIVPTDSRGLNEFRLGFPVVQLERARKWQK